MTQSSLFTHCHTPARTSEWSRRAAQGEECVALAHSYPLREDHTSLSRARPSETSCMGNGTRTSKMRSFTGILGSRRYLSAYNDYVIMEIYGGMAGAGREGRGRPDFAPAVQVILERHPGRVSRQPHRPKRCSKLTIVFHILRGAPRTAEGPTRKHDAHKLIAPKHFGAHVWPVFTRDRGGL